MTNHMARRSYCRQSTLQQLRNLRRHARSCLGNDIFHSLGTAPQTYVANESGFILILFFSWISTSGRNTTSKG